MALPQNIANSSTPGAVVALGTLTAELKTGEVKLKISAQPPAALEAAGQFTIVVDHEIMLVTGGQTSTEWTVTRKAEGSTEANHLVGAEVFDYLTAEALKAFIEEIVTPVTIKPAGNPTNAVTINPNISTATGNARGLALNVTFSGAGLAPAGAGLQCISKPSESIASAYGVLNIAKGEPPVGVTITNLFGGYYRADTGSTEGAVTNTTSLVAIKGTYGSIKPTTATGLKVENQGVAGVETAIGVDVVAQASATTNIGVRIAKSTQYALQFSDTGGTSAGGITFNTDTAIWRSAANVVKVEKILDAETGFRIGGAAASGKYLRGEGTNFVSSALKGGDLEAESVTPKQLAGGATPAYSGKVEVKTGEEIEPSATLRKFICLTMETKKTEATSIEIFVNKVWVGECSVGAAILTNSFLDFQIMVPAAQKYEIKVASGKVEKAWASSVTI